MVVLKLKLFKHFKLLINIALKLKLKKKEQRGSLNNIDTFKFNYLPFHSNFKITELNRLLLTSNLQFHKFVKRVNNLGATSS